MKRLKVLKNKVIENRGNNSKIPKCLRRNITPVKIYKFKS